GLEHMTDRSDALDARLRSMLGRLDTSPGFDERVAARVLVELNVMTVQRAAQARAEEARRYELAKRRLSWGAWIRRGLTLDTAGAAVFGGFVVHFLWPSAASRAGELTPLYTGGLWAVLGVLLALAAPLPALLWQHRRRFAGLT